MKQLTIVIIFSAMLSGCLATGKVNYTQPSAPAKTVNNKIINKSKDEAWKTAIPELGKRFYVINNLDKESGLINLSYSGGPEKYIDCGIVFSTLTVGGKEENYSFHGSSGKQAYRVWEPNAGGVINVRREMGLEGRINLIFESIDSGRTRVTANIKYIVTKKVALQNMAGQTGNLNDVISFNSGEQSSFPGGNGGPGTQCYANGKMEAELLDAIQ